MKRTVAPPKVSQSKLEQIKSGKQTKTQIGVEKGKKKVIQGVGAKYAIEEKEKLCYVPIQIRNRKRAKYASI